MTTGQSARAFTLTELLVVVAIVAILASLIYPNIGSSRAKARDATRISDISQLQLALALFYDRCGQYPATLTLAAQNGCTNGVTFANFISQIPTPPAGVTGESSYGYAVLSIATIPVSYVLRTKLESPNAAVQKGLNFMPPGSTGSWSTTFADCSNAATSVVYCVTTN